MKKGGYKIIDFNGVTLSGVAVTRTDILDSLEDNYGKVVLLTGIVIGDNAMDDCFSTPLPDGDDGFKFNAYDGYISVTKTGAVTYTVASESSIPTLISEVNNIKAKNGGEIQGLEMIQNVLSGMASKETSTGRVSGALNNTIWGIGTIAGTYIMRKMTDTTGTMLVFTEVGGKVLTASFAISGTTITYSNRYVFDGTEYTPA